jgi:hypothetical protein
MKSTSAISPPVIDSIRLYLYHGAPPPRPGRDGALRRANMAPE